MCIFLYYIGSYIVIYNTLIILTVVCHVVLLYAQLFAGTDFQNVEGLQ